MRVRFHLRLLDGVQRPHEAREQIPAVDMIFTVKSGAFARAVDMIFTVKSGAFARASIYTKYWWSSSVPSVSLAVFDQNNE